MLYVGRASGDRISLTLFEPMKIGVLKEIKRNENRVALTPSGSEILKTYGHNVLVETNAGIGSGFKNEDYLAAGAELLPDAKSVSQSADMIMKVKEPITRNVERYEGRFRCGRCVGRSGRLHRDVPSNDA